MKEIGIKAQYTKNWIYSKKDCLFEEKLKNILKQNFNPDKPNAVWCAACSTEMYSIFAIIDIIM